MLLRHEAPTDCAAISGVIERAFAGHPHSSRTEQLIVDALRSSGALSLSLVAERDGLILGHIAFSPVTIGDGALHWYGLGPLAVEPTAQGRGIGSALVRAGLAQLRVAGAAGCVVLGDAAYYTRFGFRAKPGLVYPGPPPENFMALAFAGALPGGEVSYHAAFGGEPR